MSEIYTLKNNFLTIKITSLGAELLSAINQVNSLEYLWQGDPAFWNKSSPVLFPIVGKLKDNQYFYNQKVYELSQHGFARNLNFELQSQTENRLSFRLTESEETLLNFPFRFLLEINYTLEDQTLKVDYKVVNPDQKELMLFSLGTHPGFNVPLFKGENYDDYFLTFNQQETAERFIIQDGLISNQTQTVFQNPSKLVLNKRMFFNDALVFKNLKSTQIILESSLHNHGVSLEALDFPFYGIWAKKDADFICLEPWCGIADSEEGPFELSEKEGINKLAPLEEFLRRITLRFF